MPRWPRRAATRAAPACRRTSSPPCSRPSSLPEPASPESSAARPDARLPRDGDRPSRRGRDGLRAGDAGLADRGRPGLRRRHCRRARRGVAAAGGTVARRPARHVRRPPAGSAAVGAQGGATTTRGASRARGSARIARRPPPEGTGRTSPDVWGRGPEVSGRWCRPVRRRPSAAAQRRYSLRPICLRKVTRSYIRFSSTICSSCHLAIV